MSGPARVWNGYGLRILSELPLVGASAPEGVSPDVTIRYGVAPAALPTGAARKWAAARDAFLQRVDGVACYHVTAGRRIVIEPRGGDADAVRARLLTRPLAVLLQQRGLLVLHASAVVTDAGAVLFLGDSGHGKSTLMAQFVDRGHAMLSDDLTAVSVGANGLPVALPAFPCTRLWDGRVADWRGGGRRWG